MESRLFSTMLRCFSKGAVSRIGGFNVEGLYMLLDSPPEFA